MFTQKISMDCTKEQYEKYLKEELLKMGYKERYQSWKRDIGIFTNACDGISGGMLDICEFDKEKFNRHYLGSFNAPLFLALAAMTDKAEGNYGEYVIGLKTGEFYRMREDDIVLPEYKHIRKATKEEIIDWFKDDTQDLSESPIYFHRNQSGSNDGLRVQNIDLAIKILKSKGCKILKPKTWEEV